jgi:chromosome partitioning protein
MIHIKKFGNVMILVIGGIKGGTGKTTVATNLCQMRASTGKNVLLVDADEQRSAYDWSLQRDQYILKNPSIASFETICLTGRAVYSDLLKMKKTYDDIIIDTGGRDTTSQRAALCAADKFLIPFRPRSIDIWTFGTARQLISECTNQALQSYAVINQADSTGRDNQDAMEVLKECAEITCFPFFIVNRKAFGNAAAEGLGVEELPNLDEKACNEMKALYTEIYS